MRNSNQCFEGWTKESGNHDGDCCCNCEWQRPLMAHPTNRKYSIGHGRITQQIAWICMLPEPDHYPHVYYMDKKHGMCELHTPRDYAKYPARDTLAALKNS